MDVTGPEIKDNLRRLALAQGAVALGVTTAEPLAEDGAALRTWLAAGRNGPLGYLAAPHEDRAAPRSVLPTAASAILVALATGPLPRAPLDVGLEVATFAAGQDYHRVMLRLLRGLASAASELAGRPVATHVGVDATPLLERALARRAGLGAVGKSGLLLVPGHGSHVVLGTLLLDLPLPPDAPVADDPCGTCRACLDACPTGALVAPRTVDARRCLAAWTTADSGSIPGDLRPLLGRRIYGCDACQDACPHSAWTPAAPPPHPLLVGPRSLPVSEVAAWMIGSGRTLRRAVKGRAMGHVRPQTLRRTICVALGNAGEAAGELALRAALADPSPLVQAHAAWGLQRLGIPETGSPLTGSR
jgi:epoxyqueuosine reductase